MTLSIYERQTTMIFQWNWAYLSDQAIFFTAVGLQENYQALGLYHISVDLFRLRSACGSHFGDFTASRVDCRNQNPLVNKSLISMVKSLFLMVKSFFSVVKSLFLMVKSAFLMFYCKVSPLRRCSLFRSSSRPLQLQRHFGSLQP